MALSKIVEFTPPGLSNPVSVPNAYFKIIDLKGNQKAMQIIVAAYESSDAVSPMWQSDYIFKPSVDEGAENFIKQAYEYLKTQDEYQDAEDV